MGNIPYDEFGERVIKELKENVKFFCKIIQHKFPEDKYEYSSLSLNLPLEIDFKKEKHSVHLYADIPLLIKNSTDKTENFIVICKDKAYKNDIVKIMQDILEPYIYALALLASNEVEKIDICLINQNEPIRCSISQDSNLARNILQKIFEKAFVEEYKKILPFSLFNENIESFEGLKEKLSGNHGPWSYFSGKTFFDITDENISGFSDDDNVFKESWNREIQEQRELVKDLEGVTKWN
jgi:exodeoxyribonuclease V gamma subunit